MDVDEVGDLEVPELQLQPVVKETLANRRKAFLEQIILGK